MLRTANNAGLTVAPWPLQVPAVATAPGRPACDRLLAVADRYRWWLFAVAAGPYFAAFNGQWRVQPDAALYLSLGRNLAEGRGYTNLGQVNHLVYPGWPAAIAATFRAFGSASLVPVHVLLLAITAATLALVYRLVLLHAGRPTAVVVTVGTAVTKSFFVYALELWSDMPFAMAAMAVLAGYEGAVARQPRGGRVYDWALLVGGMAVAVVTRPTAWPLGAAVVAALAVDAARGRLRWPPLVAAGAVGLIAGGICLTADLHNGSHLVLGGQYVQHMVNWLEGAVSPTDRTLGQRLYALFAFAASDVLFQVRFGDAANSVLSGVVLLLGVGLFRARVLWGWWFTLLLATLLLAAQETLDRYFLPVLPLLVYAWWSAMASLDRRPARTRGGRLALDGVVLLVLGFGALVNVTKVGGLIGQQRARPFLANYDHGRFQPVPALSDAIAARVPADGLVLVKPPYGRVTAYLSRRDAANGLEATLLPLAGRPVFVVEPADRNIRQLLDQLGLIEGPAVYSVPALPAASAKAEPLSLHTTARRSAP